MRITLRNIINFYDEKSRDDCKHVSSITGLVGEDIASGLIKHYFDNNGCSCEILKEKPTEGIRKGKWLDRWLKVESNGTTTFYQTEIKNWCSHSIGGKQLKVNAPDEELVTYGHDRFLEQWDENAKTLRYVYVSKVLKTMRTPKSVNIKQANIEPLICYWYPILSNSLKNVIAFYSVECKGNFPRVHFFSLSIYLRILLKSGVETIDIDMPNFEQRMKKIQEMYPF